MKLVAIDLDKTLLLENGSISPVNKRAIKETQKKGIKVVVSTGRSLHDAYKILKCADIESPLIVGNGALIYLHSYIFKYLTIKISTLKSIISDVKKNNLYYEVYTNKGVLMSNHGGKILQQEIEQLNQESEKIKAQKRVDKQYKQNGIYFVENIDNTNLSELKPYKLFIMSFDDEKIKEIRKNLIQYENIEITTSGSGKIEIAHKKATKGNSLESISQYLNITMNNTYAIGDNFNDVSMFKTANTGIAMKNAPREVKYFSNCVTKHYENDGVAHALNNLLD